MITIDEAKLKDLGKGVMQDAIGNLYFRPTAFGRRLDDIWALIK